MTHQPRPYPGIGHAVLMTIVALGLQNILVFFVVVAQMIAAGRINPSSDHGISPAVLAVVNIVAIYSVVAWGYAANRVSWRVLLPLTRIPPVAILPLIIGSLGLGIVLSEVDNLVRTILPVPQRFAELMGSLLDVGARPWATGFLLIVVAPLTEEALFRGVILRGLLGRHRPWVAVLVSALLFGLIHANPWQFVGATVLGLAYGWCYLRTGSLWPGIVGHAINNGAVFVLALLPIEIPGLTGTDLSAPPLHEPWWLLLAGFAALLGSAWWFRQSTPNPPDWPLVPAAQPPPMPPPLPIPTILAPATSNLEPAVVELRNDGAVARVEPPQ